MNPDVLASGYQVAEAPRADGSGGVYFSDAIAGGVHHWSEAGLKTLFTDRPGVGGMAVHADGGLIVGGPDLSHISPDGQSRTLLALPSGATAFNDLCALTDGTLLVGYLPSPPATGAFLSFDGSQPQEALGNLAFPNGCGVSPDGSTVYANDYPGGTVWARRDGHWSIFATTPAGEADGLVVDGEGGVWVAQPQAASIVRLLADGSLDQVIELPGWNVTSLAFGGDSLYLTTAGVVPGSKGGALLRIPAPVPGMAHLNARI